MKARTVHCAHCGGSVDVDPSIARHTCPYCQGDVWATATQKEAAAASARLFAAMQKYTAQVTAAQQSIHQAVQQGDPKALRAAVEVDAHWTFRAYDDAEYWQTIGVNDETQKAEHKARQIESILEGWLRQMTPSSTSVETEKAAYQAYQQALKARDLKRAETHFMRYMLLLIDRTPGLEDSTPEWKKEASRSSFESTIRGLDWVSSRDLEELGFDILDDAKQMEGGVVEVNCQNCGAPFEVPPGREQATCPYCEAITKLELSLTDQTQSFRESFRESTSTTSASAQSSKSHLDSAREIVSDGFPEVDLESARGSSLTYFFLEQGFEWAMSEEAFSEVRRDLGLGDSFVCDGCSSKFHRAPGIRTCPMCQTVITT